MSFWTATPVKIGGVALLFVGSMVALALTVGDSSGRREWNEHGTADPRAKDDPRNGHLSGCVRSAGAPVPGVTIVATAVPHGYGWTTDSAVTGPDGCYDVAITARHFIGKQVVNLEVGQGDYDPTAFVGKLRVEAEPGRTTEHADIEAGKGVWVSGVVRDLKGAPVAHVYVHDQDGCYAVEPTDDSGRFAIRLLSVGRHRLETEYEQPAPALFDVSRLDGYVDNVVLTIGRQRQHYERSEERELPAARRFAIKPVAIRGIVPPPHWIWCTAWARRSDGTLYPTVTASGFDIDLLPTNIHITCDNMGGFADNGREIDATAIKSPIELPVVPRMANGVNLGVELRAHPSGALVAGVVAEAQAAGLQPGDVVVAIDGVSVAGFMPESVDELGFHLAPGQHVSWTIERGAQRMALQATAPGTPQPPAYGFR